jgi:hypothetical protein
LHGFNVRVERHSKLVLNIAMGKRDAFDKAIRGALYEGES